MNLRSSGSAPSFGALSEPGSLVADRRRPIICVPTPGKKLENTFSGEPVLADDKGAILGVQQEWSGHVTLLADQQRSESPRLGHIGLSP